MPLTTAVTEALKEHYKPQRIKEMVYKNNPLLALIPKYTKFGGENMPMPIITTGPQRRSATFATGQANTSTSSLKQFLLTRVSDYSFASISHEAIRRARAMLMRLFGMPLWKSTGLFIVLSVLWRLVCTVMALALLECRVLRILVAELR